MMYAVIIEDRHTDVEVRLFREQANARQAARELYEDYASELVKEDPEICGENTDDFYCYSVEGDCITVVSLWVQDEQDEEEE